MQFVEYSPWIERFNIHYHLGVDGIAMPLILLNCFTTPLVVIAGWEVISKRVSQYMGAFLIMSGIVNGVFSSLDAILFYVFWEASLIPMFLIVGVWGGPNRVYAAIKFFLYTLLGSLLMLVAFIYLYQVSGGSFSILDYHQAAIAAGAASTDIYRLPAGVCGKGADVAGSYLAARRARGSAHRRIGRAGGDTAEAWGLRFPALFASNRAGCQPLSFRNDDRIVPDCGRLHRLVALVQADMKKLIAYSSVSHMGFVTLGFFLFNAYGVEGAMVQMISHGFISGAMFLCVGVMYDRLHSRQIADYGGVANKMPVFAAFFMLFAMANSGLPGTSGFVGEFMVIMAAIKVNFWYAFLAAITLIFGAAYTLWMYKRVVFGAVVHPAVEGMKDINGREILILAVLAAGSAWMGLYPLPLTGSHAYHGG